MKERSQKVGADAQRESDEVILPKKQPNKEGKTSAEDVEERTLTEGNVNEKALIRIQGREMRLFGLDGVRKRAKEDKKCRFTSLLHHITPALLRESFYKLNRKATAGVDGETWKSYEKKLDSRLKGLHEEIHKGSYRAKPVKRKYIEKDDGSQRPLGITSVEDKLVQQAVCTVLECIYTNDFLGNSYGFRKGKSQHDALDAIATVIQQYKVSWILDADLQKFFDTIDHAHMLEFLNHRLGDQRIIRLIRKWLKTGYSEEGKIYSQTIGTPQGSVISPLLANIYLHYALDLWIKRERKLRGRGEIYFVRYADDFVMGFQYKGEGERFLRELRKRLGKLGQTLHPVKTRLIEFGRFASTNYKKRGMGKPETFDFLGLTHMCALSTKGNFWVKRCTIKKRYAKKVREVKVSLRKRINRPIYETGHWLNSVVVGFKNYHGIHGNMDRVNGFRTTCIRLWKKTLNRRSQKGRSLTWKRFGPIANRFIPNLKSCHEYPEVRFNAKYPR